MSTNKVEHPLEEIFDIAAGTTELVIPDKRPLDLAEAEEYDNKDKEIEGQFQEVYTAAMDAFEAQSGDAELIDPKYRARTQEVAAQYLNTALNAAKEKSTLKQHKDKLNIAQVKNTGPKTLNQNLIVADRNEILRHIAGKKEESS